MMFAIALMTGFSLGIFACVLWTIWLDWMDGDFDEEDR